MNLQALANPYIAAVNSNFIGSLMVSAGDIPEGDAVITGSITGTTLTVTAVASGALVINSVLNAPLVETATMIVAQITGTAGGIGTYKVSRAQTVISGTINATGTGKRIPQFVTTNGITMQVQAVTGGDLEHTDGLNLQTIARSVYLNGRAEGVDRAALKGGDLLLIPTGLTTTPPAMDTWLIRAVAEPWDTGGWTRVIVILQLEPQSQ